MTVQSLLTTARIVIVLAASPLLGAHPAAGAPMTFYLIPADKITGAQLEDAVRGGTVFLYEPGAYEPTWTLPTHTEVEVPPGTWFLAGEAPGFVTIEAGQVVVGADHESVRAVVWPVVEACEAVLAESETWRGIQRLDLVAIGSGAVFPVDPSKRSRLQVPREPLIAYGVDREALTGIDRAGRCAPGRPLIIEPPLPPPAGFMDLLATASARRLEDFDPGLFVARLDSGRLLRSEPFYPDTIVSQRSADGTSTSFFFLDLPAGEATRALTLQHPRLRTKRLTIAARPGEGIELPVQEMAARRELALDIRYAPIGDHTRREVSVLYCGFDKAATSDMSRCREVDQVQLEPGQRTYRFDQLDDGQYVFRARIGDEFVHGLGAKVVPYIDPRADMLPSFPLIELIEFEITGQILFEGRPVDGYVFLEEAGWPTRRFETDSGREFHLRYFGRQPLFEAWIPEGDRDRPRHENLGLFGEYFLGACSAEGACRQFNFHSRLRGGGQLDLEIGDGRRVHVTVSDSETKEPIAGVTISYPPGQALRFDHGEVEWVSPDGGEWAINLTDSLGETLVSVPVEGNFRIGVIKDGYESKPVEVEPEKDNEVTYLEVDLQRTSQVGAVRVELADGSPAASAFALVFRDEGHKDFRCSRRVSSNGWLRFSPPCLSIPGAFALIHPEAAISWWSMAMAATASIELPPRPPQPLRIRIRDVEGYPLENVSFELRYSDGTLSSDDVMTALAAAGVGASLRTDRSGEAPLTWVDAWSSQAPEVGIAGRDKTFVSTWMFEPGEEIQIMLNS